MSGQTPDGAANRYPQLPSVDAGPLPDPFLNADGTRVKTRSEWPARADAWRDLIVTTEYGGMPPHPERVVCDQLCAAGVRRWPSNPRLYSHRVRCEGAAVPFSFVVRTLVPQGAGPFPVVLNGDGCWWYISDDVAQRIVESGYALVMFNRTEMVEDRPPADDRSDPRRSGGLYDAYPDRSFGALAAWAWGYHRCVDAIHELGDELNLDLERIAVTGHSRGGKAVLVAAATDRRIAVVNDNASGAGGAAVMRYVGDGAEALGIVNYFPSWFGPQPGLRPYIGREADAPFDQHCLLATIAPRPLLLTYALDDRWSNPEGMVQSATAAREVYRFLGAPDNLAYHLRAGEHLHAREDWDTLLDFLGMQWAARAPSVAYNDHPYHHLRPAFGWSAPE